MGLELPLVSAVIARLPEAKIHLAAYGGVVFPLSMLIESPVIMLLSASTALSRDERSYRIGRRIMLALSGGFTALHALVAFTPLYDLLARRVLGVPEDIVEPARWGLQVMTPWTLAIGYRRFQQGVLIRFGRAREVGLGTGVRLATNATALAVGAAIHGLPGIVVGSAAVALGVVAEAIFAGIRVRPVRHGALRSAPASEPPLTTRRFLTFYIPLMVTPLIMLLASPLTSAAMSRMPLALDSLATWPAVSGLLFTLRSTGYALNEVVVAMLDRPGAWQALRRLGAMIGLVTSSLLLATAATPLGGLWLGRISALPPALVTLGSNGLWFGVLVPAVSAAQSLYQGSLLYAHKTRGVSESVTLFLVVSALALGIGVAWRRLPGLPVAVAASALGSIAQVGWLRFRARGTVARLSAAEPAVAAHAPVA
jgi:progressive ankylosis protein